MIKYALAFLAITLTIANLASRFIPNELRQISLILSWLLGAYVAIVIALGLIANFSQWWK